ncbi:6-phosphogluconolactonase [Thiohalocapsa marina]|uniref:6-phosphogluconolactonase n=1 Tax=Thiohalocapsa marina TaxID=424902 RepID=A0A5M8FVB0_9GAMM|nr:6-phosphogluconolactonase [Thiohalocapsa marina]KAA6187703.1 6-phosphogluconolactonase [Thiohalocapsa marina]
MKQTDFHPDASPGLSPGLVPDRPADRPLDLSGVDCLLFEDAAAVAEAAAEWILEQARRAIAARGAFRIVLAGGTTPLMAYRRLAQAQSADWSAWHVYHGDERCLPADDAERNSRAADQAWLGRVSIPPRQIHVIPAELGPEAAALDYQQPVAAALPFDLVLLGMGEDGHTASLFPDRPLPSAEQEDTLVMPVQDAPKPPPERVSLTPRALCASREILLLITGAAKHAALVRWQAGESLPAACIARAGNTTVLLDRAAAG